MTIISILDIAENLIKVIEENKTSGQISENEFCSVIPSKSIDKQLEELREWVKNRTLEKRIID